MDNLHKKIILDKNIPVPLYYQIKSQLLSLINSGDIVEGDMIPPENEFCDALSVSRPTIRQALSELAAEGYIRRFKGRGTFVAKQKIEARFLCDLETFNTEMEKKNLSPRTEVLALEERVDFPAANNQLSIPPGAPLIALHRRRYADEVPIVLVETYLSLEDYPKFLNVDFCNKSLYDSFEELYDLRITRVIRELEAVNARRSEAELLKITRNKAITLVKTVGFAEGLPNPVEYSVAKYSGEMNKFYVELKR